MAGPKADGCCCLPPPCRGLPYAGEEEEEDFGDATAAAVDATLPFGMTETDGLRDMMDSAAPPTPLVLLAAEGEDADGEPRPASPMKLPPREFFSFILLNILTFSVPEPAFGLDAPAAFPAFFKGGGGGVGAGGGFG